MQNSLIDLNNHLFAEIERLSDEELRDDLLAQELQRAKSISDVAGKIIDNGKLMLEAEKTRQEYGVFNENINIPKVLLKNDN